MVEQSRSNFFCPVLDLSLPAYDFFHGVGMFVSIKVKKMWDSVM